MNEIIADSINACGVEQRRAMKTKVAEFEKWLKVQEAAEKQALTNAYTEIGRLFAENPESNLTQERFGIAQLEAVLKTQERVGRLFEEILGRIEGGENAE